MSSLTLPTAKPRVPNFSSGPCAKRPGWSVSSLKNAFVGRSHRSVAGKARLDGAPDELIYHAVCLGPGESGTRSGEDSR